MSPIRARQFALFACCSIVCASLLPQCTAAPLTIYNTGVDGSANAWGSPNVADIHYSIIVQPGFATAVTVDDTTYPFPPWLANNGLSRWIGPAADSQGPGGNYVYRTTFNVPNAAILSSVNVSGDWATDDPGTDIRINGTPTGQTSASFQTLTPFSVTNGFVLGTNTLDFYLTNAGGPTGLRVDHIKGSYLVPEPGAVWLAAMALVLSGALLRRMRSTVPVT